MRYFPIAGFLAMVLGVVVTTHAQPNPPEVLGEVLGKKITEQDLKPSKNTLEYWAKLPPDEAARQRIQFRKDAFATTIMAPLMERYITEHALQPTEEEIQAFLDSPIGRAGKDPVSFHESQIKDIHREIAEPGIHPGTRKQLEETLVKMQRRLEDMRKPEWPDAAQRQKLKEEIPALEAKVQSPDLMDADRKSIETSLAYNKRFANLTDEQAALEHKNWRDELQRDVGKQFVQTWKTYRALHKQYGGRIIWQQFGIEPIDAMRDWRRELEKKGDFVIHDEALRESFWAYFLREHPFTTEKPKGDEFDKPMWLQLPAPPGQ